MESYIQFALLVIFFFFLWIMKLQRTTARKEVATLKTYNPIDFITLIWMLFEKQEINLKQKTRASRFQKLYKRFLSSTSGYTKEPAFLKIFGMRLAMIPTNYETLLEMHKSDAFNDRLPEVLLNLYAGGKPGGVLLNNTKTHWSELRRFIVKAMAQLGLGKKDKVNSIISQQLPEFMERVDTTRRDTGNKIQVVGLFSVATTNAIIAAIVGRKFSEDDPDFVGFSESVLYTGNTHIFKYFCLQFAGKIYGAIRLLGLTKTLEMINKLRAVSLKLVNSREALKNEDPESLVDLFLQKIDKHKDDDKLKDIFCKHQLVAVVQDFLVAGMDTTGKFNESVLMHLCLYPDVQDRVHQEIDAVMGTSAVPLYFECKSKMHYTLAVFHEVHRMTNINPIIPRFTTKDVTIAGHHVKKGTLCAMPLFLIRYDDTYWKDPYTFNPERFLDENGHIIQDKVDRLIAFGAGPRICPGEIISRAMSFSFVTGILQKYTVKKYDDSEILALGDDCGTNVGPEPFHISISER